MALASLFAAAVATLMGLLLTPYWRRQQAAPLWKIGAHAGCAAAALLLLLLAGGGRSPVYAWALGALGASIALGVLMFLYRERLQRFPQALPWLHGLAAVAAVVLLAALARAGA